MLAEKGQRPLVPSLVRQVGVEDTPLLPQRALGEPLDGLPADAAVGGILQQMHQQTVVVEHRADADDVGVPVARLAHRTEKPPLQLAPSVGGQHLLIVFDVVQHDQVGSPRPVAAAAELLPRAHRVDAAAVLQQNHAVFPHFALLIAEIGDEGLVFLQFGLDTVQKGGGLTFGVGDEKNILFIAEQGGVEHVLQAHHGGFGVSPGRRQRQPAAGGGKQLGQGVGGGRFALHHLLFPQTAQRPVEGRGGAGEIVAQIPPPEQLGVCSKGHKLVRRHHSFRNILYNVSKGGGNVHWTAGVGIYRTDSA